MISSSTVTAFIIALTFTLALPIILLIVLGIRKKISFLPLFIGATAFFLSQIVLRIPLISALSTQSWYQNLSTMFIPYILILSFSAGLFEESARLGGALLLKKRRSYKDVISFGLGHAFCEVIILVGMTHINNVIFCLAINGGDSLAPITAAIPIETLETVTAQLSAVNAVDIYGGIVERFSTVLFHIFATVLVFNGVVKKKGYYFWLAVAAHTVFNFIGALLNNVAGTVIVELVLLIMALAAGWYVLISRNGFNNCSV